VTAQTLYAEPLSAWVMACGYILAAVILCLLAVGIHLGVRKDRRIARLEREVKALTARRDFLDEQNRALFKRRARGGAATRRRVRR
jgi:uncharacterized membrane protein YciS (DUF1049 family)